MIGASMLPGDTLIAWHYPGVQFPVQALCGVAKRPARLCSVGLTRAVSLPERDTLNREHAFAAVRRHFSCSYGSLIEDRAEEEGASDSSGRYDSTSSPEEAPRRTSSRVTNYRSGTRGCQRSHNSFLPSAGLEEDEEDEDSDGDNLHRYREDSSFVLHGNPHWSLSHGASAWGKMGALMGAEEDWLSNRRGCRSGITLMACEVEDADRLRDNASYFTHSAHKCSPELFSSSHADCASDSSCNSSDGVLVNFCAIYNRSNNPATPHDLSSPAPLSPPSPEGSVFLNLRPVPHADSADLQSGTAALYSPQEDRVDATPSAPCWSPRGVDSNRNLCSLSHGLSSLEVSDLTACLQSRASLPMGTNQKYYRLVTCDLSSKSPSPAWSSLTSYPEDLSRSGTLPPSEHLGDSKEEREKDAKKVSSTSAEKSQCRKAQTDSTQTLCHTSCSVCHIQDSQSTECQGASVASTEPSVSLDRAPCATPAKVKGKTPGAGSPDNPCVRYSKAQRPTSLPIRPFVLIPADKPRAQSQHLGCLLEQYMNHKSSKSSSSQTGFKLKGKGGHCFAKRQPSPMSAHRPISQEAPSSSDTCSTCTPSPECFSYRRPTIQTGSDPTRAGPKPMLVPERDQTGPYPGETADFATFAPTPNQSSLIKIPTCQDLIALTPEPTRANADSTNQSPDQSRARLLSSPTPRTLPANIHHHKPPQRRALAPDSGFFLGLPLMAAPLSSLSSLLSHVGSGLHRQQTRDRSGLTEKQSERGESLILTEFCLTPDASYESLSISHLQRRGLLRAASRAVDLIMAHFDNTRDPEEKMRLGNSSRSPTITGLVLEHLCPAIQNILEDGLKDHKLDLVVGRQRSDSWNVVEVSTRAGPSTRVLHSLVSKIRQCPQLSSHCMRLRAFIMGLLNLRSLEFWLSHLQSQQDMVTAHYHSWGFLSMSLGQCRPLFQELLLLLQPLSVLPFDLNLLLEPRLLQAGQLCAEKQGVSPPPPCSTLLMTSWPLLQKTDVSNHRANGNQESLVSQNSSLLKQEFGEIRVTSEDRRSSSAHIPEWWLRGSARVDGVVEAGDCSQNYAKPWCQIQEEKRERREKETPRSSLGCHDQDHSQGGLRWAKLFGAASDVSSRTERESQSHSAAQSKRSVRPSQWLNLDRSKLGLLVQSIRSMKLGGSSDRQ